MLIGHGNKKMLILGSQNNVEKKIKQIIFLQYQKSHMKHNIYISSQKYNSR
jgi:hypothetical protein